jgi:hypothetical protein
LIGFAAIVVGAIAVIAVLTDLVNTLVTTSTATGRWWLTRVIMSGSWRLLRAIAVRVPEGRRREALLSLYAPVLVLLLLVTWVVQQIIGFGLIWWGLNRLDPASVSGVDGLLDSIYYSGVVFFTVGFGEVVPTSTVPRFGALIEAFAGVLTTALVIGYLPALYSAYSERERKLMTLDDGTESRITPTSLVMAWAPTADPDELVERFQDWEEWVAGILETHTTFPMLRLFRSHHEGQSWITALGLIADAGLHCQLIVGAQDRAPLFVVRRVARLLQELTVGVDLSEYREQFDEAADDGGLFRDLYHQLEHHGFELVPFDEARTRGRAIRSTFDAPLEYLIDELVTPRGFWGHSIGLHMGQQPIDHQSGSGTHSS